MTGPCTWCGEPATWHHADGSAYCSDCGRCEQCAAEIAGVSETCEDRWLCPDCAAGLQREADECSRCRGTGIGQHFDPDTSRCSACGGRGYHMPERDDEPPDPEEPLNVPVGYDGTGRY